MFFWKDIFVYDDLNRLKTLKGYIRYVDEGSGLEYTDSSVANIYYNTTKNLPNYIEYKNNSSASAIMDHEYLYYKNDKLTKQIFIEENAGVKDSTEYKYTYPSANSIDVQQLGPSGDPTRERIFR